MENLIVRLYADEILHAIEVVYNILLSWSCYAWHTTSPTGIG